VSGAKHSQSPVSPGGTVGLVSEATSAEQVRGTGPEPTRARKGAKPVPRRRGTRPDEGVTGPEGVSPRRRARRGEGERLREEILDATTALLIETGSADKVSTRAVARRAGCTSPSIYLHFPDKAALLYAVCERQFDSLGIELEQALAGIDGPIERLIRGAHTYARFALEHPEHYRIMMLDEAYSENYEGSLEHLAGSPGFSTIVTTVQEGMEAGQLAPGDPVMVSLTLWAAVHGLVSLLVVKPRLDLPPFDVLIDQLCTHLIDGLLPRPLA